MTPERIAELRHKCALPDETDAMLDEIERLQREVARLKSIRPTTGPRTRPQEVHVHHHYPPAVIQPPPAFSPPHWWGPISSGVRD